MSSDDFDKLCIAIERRHLEPRLFTVADYDEGIRRSRSIGTTRGLVFWELIWTRVAPAVEELTPEGRETEAGLFRIVDPEAYDLQMRRLFGLV